MIAGFDLFALVYDEGKLWEISTARDGGKQFLTVEAGASGSGEQFALQ